jgi:large subunit ribosomal protein L21
MKKESNKYAVVRLTGKQYRVSEGQEILVDKIKDTKKIEYEVLLMVDTGKVKVGKPVVKDSKVDFEVLQDMEKGDKVSIFKYKSKSRYRKRAGFRAKLTRLLIKKIS